MRRTKIVCTLGPATDAVLEGLVHGGMDVARFNFSHGTHAEHLERLNALKHLRDGDTQKHLRDGDTQAHAIATLLDTRGPEVRLGMFEGGSARLEKGQSFVLTAREIIGSSKTASVSHAGLPADLSLGTRILLDDGRVALRVASIHDTDITCTVLNSGTVSNRKSVNVPDVELSLPYVGEQDLADLRFAVTHGFDFVAASFVRRPEDVAVLKGVLHDSGGDGIQIIAKIENRQGVENCSEILDVCDGIMIARGDLGVEIDFEDIPPIQKRLVRMAHQKGKIAITATQMLESMTSNPRPTRAETSDVANAVYEGTSAIMLSSETTIGKYPVEALKTMARIAEICEQNIDYVERFENDYCTIEKNVTNAISHATCTTAHDLDAAAIVAITTSGQTARMVSRFRPDCPIIAPTRNEQTFRQLALSWGVTPVVFQEKDTTDALLDSALQAAMTTGQIKRGDHVVITFGTPLGVPGNTNVLRVHQVG